MQRNGVLRCRGTYSGGCDCEAATGHNYYSTPHYHRPIF